MPAAVEDDELLEPDLGLELDELADAAPDDELLELVIILELELDVNEARVELDELDVRECSVELDEEL